MSLGWNSGRSLTRSTNPKCGLPIKCECEHFGTKRPANQRSRELTDEDVEMLRHVRDGLRRELNDYVRRRVSRSLDNAEGNLSIEEMFAVAARATDLWHQETGISLDDLARLAALIEGGGR